MHSSYEESPTKEIVYELRYMKNGRWWRNVLSLVLLVTNTRDDWCPTRGTNKQTQDREKCSL